MSADFYRYLHFFGILMVLAALGGQLVEVMYHGGKNPRSKKFLAISHGVALLFIAVSGFGMLHKLSLAMTGWVYGKFAIWFCLGIGGAVAVRKPQIARAIWFILILLGVLAAYLARNKPF